MKHIISLCLAVFFMAGIQNAQAQSKEETIQWLKEKLEQHGGGESNYEGKKVSSTLEDVKVTPCSISFTQKFSHSPSSGLKTSFNPSVVKLWSVADKGISTDAPIIQLINNSSGKIHYSDFISVRDGEPDLQKRMIKALVQLATFCGKNETF